MKARSTLDKREEPRIKVLNVGSEGTPNISVDKVSHVLGKIEHVPGGRTEFSTSL